MNSNILYFKYNNNINKIYINQNEFGDIDENSINISIDFIKYIINSVGNPITIWLEDTKGNIYNEININIDKILLYNKINGNIFIEQPNLYNIFIDYIIEVINPKYIYDSAKRKLYNKVSKNIISIEKVYDIYKINSIARKIFFKDTLYLVQ